MYQQISLQEISSITTMKVTEGTYSFNKNQQIFPDISATSTIEMASFSTSLITSYYYTTVIQSVTSSSSLITETTNTSFEINQINIIALVVTTIPVLIGTISLLTFIACCVIVHKRRKNTTTPNKNISEINIEKNISHIPAIVDHTDDIPLYCTGEDIIVTEPNSSYIPPPLNNTPPQIPTVKHCIIPV